jgi:hypothetical protein
VPAPAKLTAALPGVAGPPPVQGVLRQLPGIPGLSSPVPPERRPVPLPSVPLPGRSQDRQEPLSAVSDLLGKILTALQSQPQQLKQPAPGARPSGPARYQPRRAGEGE